MSGNFDGNFFRSSYPRFDEYQRVNEVGYDQLFRSRASFSYDESDQYGPQNWGNISKDCDGGRQSPINLEETRAKSDAVSLPLIIDGFHNLPKSIEVVNSGHSLTLRFNYPDGKPARFIGGPLRLTPYILDNIHFHWGSRDDAGSEHTLNSRQFAAEAHFVLYNSNYGKALLFGPSWMFKNISLQAH